MRVELALAVISPKLKAVVTGDAKAGKAALTRLREYPS